MTKSFIKNLKSLCIPHFLLYGEPSFSITGILRQISPVSYMEKHLNVEVLGTILDTLILQ